MCRAPPAQPARLTIRSLAIQPVRPSVRPSVRPPVRPSVRPPVLSPARRQGASAHSAPVLCIYLRLRFYRFRFEGLAALLGCGGCRQQQLPVLLVQFVAVLYTDLELYRCRHKDENTPMSFFLADANRPNKIYYYAKKYGCVTRSIIFSTTDPKVYERFCKKIKLKYCHRTSTLTKYVNCLVQVHD